MSRVDVIRGPVDELRADGLWAGVLRALSRSPRTPDDLIAATTSPGARFRRRRKVYAALHGLARNGWAAARHEGWVITPEGEAAVAAMGNVRRGKP